MLEKENISQSNKQREIENLKQQINELKEAIEADETLSKQFGVQQQYGDTRPRELAELRIKLNELKKE